MINFKKVRLSTLRGFTLIELLVVIAIIAILASVVLALMSSARGKGVDAAVKANLSNAAKQAEVFYNVNSVAVNTYTSVCTNAGAVGGVLPVGPMIEAAGKAYGLASPYYTRNNATPSAAVATCNDSVSAWAAEVPLKTTVPAANQMWCVDSTGKSVQETGSSLANATDYTCN